MNPLRYFYIPLAMLLLLALLATSQDSVRFGWMPIVPMVGIALVYMFSSQIKWWYFRRYPPDLNVRLAPLLDQFAFYRQLDNAGKREFRRKAFLFRESIDFRAQAMPQVPPDIRLFVAASAATAFYYHTDPPYDAYNVVIAYPHPFPSPRFEPLHLSELEPSSGVLIFSLPDLVKSVVEPHEYLQLGLYEYGRVWQLTQPDRSLPQPSWAQISAISGFTEAASTKWHGFPELDRAAIGLTLYFTHAQTFARTYPQLFQSIDRIVTCGS